jgi:DDE superfamily endonuclease
MLTVPVTLQQLIVRFAPLFSKRVWEHAKVLVVGAILAPGRRTGSAALRVMGLSAEPHFQNYHRVLNRAVWSVLAASRILLGVLVPALAPTGVVVIGLDDTIERRRGEKSTAKGIYRDPVRSSRSHVVKASGLRWLCCALLVRIEWAQRIWALPFLTALCPSERFYQKRGRAHQKLTDRAWQLIQGARRWLPGREVVFVADSSFAVITLLKRVRDLAQVSLITRLRLDAALYDPAPPTPPKRETAAERGAAANPPTAVGEASPDLDALDPQALVWRGRAARGGLYEHCCVVSQRHAPGADSLGVGSRSAGRVRAPGAALDHPHPLPAADPGMVRPPLDPGSYL